jgi:hypothetical protein
LCGARAVISGTAGRVAGLAFRILGAGYRLNIPRRAVIRDA